ncbi:nitroreductase family protein [Clostridium sp. 19966]|nr:nitroreductase family protein [Clostridium sp. 19966]
MKIALLAPSSWGRHSVEFVIVEDKITIEKLARCKRMGAGPLKDASVAIVVIVDRSDCELWIEDGAVAATYLLLAAEELGVGACWIHMRGRDGQVGTAEEDIQELLGIPSNYGVLNVVALGHKGEFKLEILEKNLPFQNIHNGKF